ncbi:MAG: CDP-archaeol synthase [Candidatus Woesearchaeota archaeon]|nr:MAG: CDP-archaeol synthase [Candidatus Woesearchaeota archaeon]
MITTTLLGLFWLFLPAGFANMAPVIFKGVDLLNKPIDFGKTFRGKRIFGAHKTFRGFFFGILLAIVILYWQTLLAQKTAWFALLDYSSISVLGVGFLLGFGALGGDALKSFFKRQCNIKPGARFIPFDEIDWVVGTLVCLSFIVSFSWLQIILSLVMFSFLHILTNFVSFTLGLRKTQW